jgi:hypothetical protein
MRAATTTAVVIVTLLIRLSAAQTFSTFSGLVLDPRTPARRRWC